MRWWLVVGKVHKQRMFVMGANLFLRWKGDAFVRIRS